ncbi:MAG: hypothetical protein ABI768_04360 [Acidobacteriota bacterium]
MARKKKPVDPFEADFGPGVASPDAAKTEAGAPRAGGPIPGLACGGEGCFLRPAAGLVGKFSVSLAGRAALGRAAFSGIELMKALRDFLDEEIALAERATTPGGARYEKIRVE